MDAPHKKPRQVANCETLQSNPADVLLLPDAGCQSSVQSANSRCVTIDFLVGQLSVCIMTAQHAPEPEVGSVHRTTDTAHSCSSCRLLASTAIFSLSVSLVGERIRRVLRGLQPAAKLNTLTGRTSLKSFAMERATLADPIKSRNSFRLVLTLIKSSAYLIAVGRPTLEASFPFSVGSDVMRRPPEEFHQTNRIPLPSPHFSTAARK